MKKFQKRVLEIAKKLGFLNKMKTASLTADEQKQLFAEYESAYGTTYAADMKANEDDGDDDNDNDKPTSPPTSSTDAGDRGNGAPTTVAGDGGNGAPTAADDNADNGRPAEQFLSAEEQTALAALIPNANMTNSRQVTVTQALNLLQTRIEEQQRQINTLSSQSEPLVPLAVLQATDSNDKVLTRAMGFMPHTSKHLFGIEDDFFARGKWWNEISINRKEIDVNTLSRSQVTEFSSAFEKYNNSFERRLTYLNEHSMFGSLDFQKMTSGENYIDYSDLFGKAGEYIVRRQDLIIAYLRTLPSVGHIFPLVSNVQNKMIAPGANFGELSQGYRKGEIYKGNVNFTAEVYSVVDIMFKYLFDDMLRLEKQYIGYLNREGSDVIKWTFIEWIMVHFGKILLNEENRRKVSGVAVPQQNVVSNPAMLAADGVLRAITRAEEELKVLPFKDLKIYTESTIVDYLEDFYDRVEQLLPSMNGMKMYVNEKHKRWYIRAFREKYGLQNDFTGVKPTGLIDVSDYIIWVPNMHANCYKVWITPKGNLENYEDKKLEMIAFYFERDWEDIRVLSRWKGGSGARQFGVQYKTLAELEASGRKNQWLFTNYPVTDLGDSATTINGSLNNTFLTAANTTNTALADITNASEEVVYKIICGSMTKATTIAKAGKFANISAAWTPAAVGDYIELYAEREDYTVVVDGQSVTMTRPTGNWLELGRKVSI
jgi:hypothetical protein